MQMRVARSLSVVLAMACTSVREGQPQRMKSLILPIAAINTMDRAIRRWELPKQLEWASVPEILEF